MNIETTFNHTADDIETACGLEDESKFIKNTIFELSKQLKSKNISETLEELFIKVRHHLGVKENRVWKDEMLAVCIAFKYGQLLFQIKKGAENNEIDKEINMLKDLIKMMKGIKGLEDKE
jgi:hypothetical protein